MYKIVFIGFIRSKRTLHNCNLKMFYSTQYGKMLQSYMGKVEDVGGVVTQGVGVGKKFSAAFGGQKFTPMGMGPGEGG